MARYLYLQFPMDKLQQVLKRNIGSVSIIDFKGDFVGHWVLRSQEKIISLMKSENKEKLVINLRPLEMIDSLGVKAILENLPKKDTAVLSGNVSVMELFDSYEKSKSLRIFSNEEELVRHFGKDMVKPASEKKNDQRKYGRIQTALPLVFQCQNQDGEKFRFHAIVVDMSENGLFAEYIDLDEACESHSFTNPYELKMLDLEIKLPNRQTVQAHGKVVRRSLDGEQVGIGVEFYGINPEDREKIRAYLEKG